MARYSYRSTRRNWVKLWTAEWLRGTSRFELTPTQRSAWIDLLAMAGDSRIPGTICAGHDGDGAVLGYPRMFIAGLLTISEKELEDSLLLFQKQGRLEIQHDKNGNPVIILSAWKRYQSEYHRQKSYKSNSEDVTPELTHQPCSTLPVEGEGEVEVEGEVEENLGSKPLPGITPSPAQSEHLKSSPVSSSTSNPEKQIQDAQAELRKNPNSSGAKLAFDMAMNQVRAVAAKKAIP